jgi:multidrug efflux pump subunit AcrB
MCFRGGAVLSALISGGIRFKFLLIALAAGVMILGILRLPQMHVDVLPETSPTVVVVQTEALGLSAPEVEALVTVPLEKNLLEGVMGVTNVTSDSIPGLSAIELHFAPGTNLYQARQLVQERLTGAFVLPNVSKPPVMLQPVSSTSDVMIVGLTSATLSQIQLSVLARWTIVPRLLGVAGVANVSTFGQADRQLQVQLKPSVLAANHVTLAQVIAATGNSQLVSPLSFLQGSTPGTGGFLESPEQRLDIRHILPFGSPSNLAQVPVQRAGAKPILLGQVARIVEGHQPLIGDALVHTERGLLLVVQKLPSASVPGVTEGIDEAIAGLRPGLRNVDFHASIFRPATYIAAAEGNDRVALITAALLALAALLLLLLNLRLAVASLLSMALSLMVAIGTLQLLGYTFNALVLLGLVLALAVVAEDACRGSAGVLAELGQARDAGEDDQPRSALTIVLAAYRDFTGPLAGACVVALACVAPLFFATGLTAKFLRPAVLAFALAVLASLLVALTVSPALSAALFSVRQQARWGQALARRIRAGLTVVARLALALRAWALAGLCVAGLAGLAVVVPRLHPGPPVLADRDLVVDWNGPPGMSLTELDRITARTDHALLALPDVQDVAASLGRAVSSSQLVSTNSGQLWVTIKPDADYDQAVVAVTRVVTSVPGMRAKVRTYESASLHGALSAPPRLVDVRVYGPDFAALAPLARQVSARISGISGLGRPHVQLPVEQPEITVAVNLVQAKLHGLTPGQIRRETGTMTLGLTVGNFFQQDKVFDVVVVAQPGVRRSLTNLENLELNNDTGGTVRLGDVAKVSVASAPEDIRHQATSPYLDVRAPLTGHSAAAVAAAISRRLQAVRFPLEYHAQVVSGFPSGTTRTQFVSYLIAALIVMLLIIQALLGSWRLTWIVLAAVIVPVACAALVALAVGGSSLSAAAGVVGVLVIALRQSISCTDRIRRRHVADGGALTADLLLAAASENAPALLTSAIVTAVMLAPFIALGEAEGTELVHGAAIVIAAGLAVATLVNLLVLPAAYLAAGPVAAVPREAEADSAQGEMGSELLVMQLSAEPEA